MTITSVNYAIKDASSEPLIISQGPNRMPKVLLSPVSTEILKSSTNEKVVLVFSRGPLNLTPLLVSLQLVKHGGDVLIGLPRKDFTAQSERYADEFSSLFRDNGLFFYRNTLWCNAEMEKTTAKLSLQDVKKKPKVGTRDYRNDYVKQLEGQLMRGECSDWPRIVCTPIDYEVPDELFGETKFSLNGEVFNLKPFFPKFFIFESVNERMQSIEPLIPLIESLIERRQWGVIHFSWPYPSGLSGFMKGLDRIRESTPNKIQTFHLGIRYCLEVKEETKKIVSAIDKEGKDALTYIKNHHGFRDFSIEGGQWEHYYPREAGSLLANIAVAVLGPDSNNFESLVNMSGPFDGLIEQIRLEMPLEKTSNLDPRLLRIVQFPPFIDSFALPRETKLSTQLDVGGYRSIPILELLSKGAFENIGPIGPFTTLCRGLDAVRDLQNELNGLSTFCYPGKSYGLASYVYQCLIDSSLADLNLVIGNYYQLPGTKKAILDRIIGLLETLKRKPELSKNIVSLAGCCELFTNGGLRIRQTNDFREIKKLQYEVSSHYGEQTVEVNVSYVKNNESTTKKKITILFCDFSRLNIHLNRLDPWRTELILPGPVPMFYFDDDAPKITRGFDVVYRPLRKITFLTYPGKNLKRCVSQLSTMADIAVGSLSSPIVKKDLMASLTNNPPMFNFNVGCLSKYQEKSIEQDFVTPDDNVVDSSVLTAFVSSKTVEETSQVLTLKDIWSSVSRDLSNIQKRNGPNDVSDILSVRVKFIQDSHEEIIALNADSYVRKMVGEKDSELLLSRNIHPGDLIVYLRSGERESLDNLFIRSFSESRGWTLEQVLEPFTCLHYFYESVRRIDFDKDYDETTFHNCYWLSAEQKRAVYDSLSLLLDNGLNHAEFVDKFKKCLVSSDLWRPLERLDDEKLKSIRITFNSTRGINAEKIHYLAYILGLDYNISSFKSLLSKLRTGGKHYYFQTPTNLYAIAKLIWNQKAMESYEDLTVAGKDIRTVLELEGLSISRVISGNDNPLNAMDDLIRKRVVMCKVLDVQTK